MFPRRPRVAILAAPMLLLALSVPVAAAEPPADAAPPVVERPLTAGEQAASDRKVQAALAYVSNERSRGKHLLSLACVTPRTGTLAPSACTVPQGFLAAEARDQTKAFYCGPATGQVIANYTWAMAAGANKYTQAKLAEWMRTDINRFTNAPELAVGLERGTASAPRRPAGWAWVVTDLRDVNGSGTTADELQAFVQSNVSKSRMPLAIAVKPHDPRSAFNLSSWPDPVQSLGHWIAAYGWYSHWTGTDFARIYYTDSSRDEGGSTGKFWNSTRSLNALIMEHTRRIVW
jgi:hypothetical protein